MAFGHQSWAPSNHDSRRAWWILAAWAVAVAAAVPMLARLPATATTHLRDLMPRHAESMRAQQLIGQDADPDSIALTVVVYQSGPFTPGQRQRVADCLTQASVEGLRSPTSVAFATDRRAAAASYLLRSNQTQLRRVVEAIRIKMPVACHARVGVTGAAGVQADILSAFGRADRTRLLLVVLLVLGLLTISYRSLSLCLLPLVTATAAQIVTAGLLYLAARATGAVTAQSVSLLTVLVFGAVIDYTLLLTARVRERPPELATVNAAIARATTVTRPTILLSAVTVVSAIACLYTADMTVTRSFMVVGAMSILTSVVAALTLYPALLTLFGKRGLVGGARLDASASASLWAEVATRIARTPRRAWMVGLLVLVLLSIGLGGYRDDSTSRQQLPVTTPSLVAARILAHEFSTGQQALDIVGLRPSDTRPVRDAVRRVLGVAGVQPYPTSRTRLVVRLDQSLSPSQSLRVTRAVRAAAKAASHGVALTGGELAQDVDTIDASKRDDMVVIPLVLGLLLMILLFATRAVIASVVLLVSLIATYAAALGVACAASPALFGVPGLDPTVPLLGFVFLAALGVDYNIFLISRMLEERSHQTHQMAVLNSLRCTGGVLSSAGVVLGGTFAFLMAIPVGASQELGLLVSTGVILDTLLVRTIIVPALALDIGQRFWVPRTWPASPLDEAWTSPGSPARSAGAAR